MLDWIFENGDTDFIKVKQVKEFVKNRLNESLNRIGLDSVFEVDAKELSRTKWFDEEVLSDTHFDFFDQRPTSYTIGNKSITADDLF